MLMRILEGWLEKSSFSLFGKKWDNLFFHLEGDKLCYYHSELDFEHLGYIDLRKFVEIKDVDDNITELEIFTTDKKYVVRAKSKRDKTRWKKGIQVCYIYYGCMLK
eukprot:TRINITY_DN8467_c0_g1_i3.p1 TRINITY_DN8467_c0_g1~~TRINITY_DN8467_c0_g1_i3.p1  ORF type:complete len:106 (-),score=24.06 TRINITY_DN8467_c0_g1_i3:31-348(-)